MNETIVTILTSGVVATAITSFVSWKSNKNTNERLLQIESVKNDNSIQTFRYTKLYELNVELNHLPDMDYTMLKKEGEELIHDSTKIEKVMGEAAKRY